MTRELLIDYNKIPLESCPFCGSSAVHMHLRYVGESLVGSIIQCYGCLAVFCYAEATCPEDTADAWNRRAKSVS